MNVCKVLDGLIEIVGSNDEEGMEIKVWKRFFLFLYKQLRTNASASIHYEFFYRL